MCVCASACLSITRMLVERHVCTRFLSLTTCSRLHRWSLKTFRKTWFVSGRTWEVSHARTHTPTHTPLVTIYCINHTVLSVYLYFTWYLLTVIFVSIMSSACTSEVEKVCKVSDEDSLQPFKDKMDEFLAQGNWLHSPLAWGNAFTLDKSAPNHLCPVLTFSTNAGSGVSSL